MSKKNDIMQELRIEVNRLNRYVIRFEMGGVQRDSSGLCRPPLPTQAKAKALRGWGLGKHPSEVAHTYGMSIRTLYDVARKFLDRKGQPMDERLGDRRGIALRRRKRPGLADRIVELLNEHAGLKLGRYHLWQFWSEYEIQDFFRYGELPSSSLPFWKHSERGGDQPNPEDGFLSLQHRRPTLARSTVLRGLGLGGYGKGLRSPITDENGKIRNALVIRRYDRKKQPGPLVWESEEARRERISRRTRRV